MPLPNNGDLNWGTPLNADIEADESNISLLTTSVSEHEANVPPDPHGDRAFTSGLVTPITTGLNLPPAPGVSLGLVQLGANGKIPLGLVPTGAGLTNFIDAIPDFGVLTTGAPTAKQLNAALFAAAQSGGGIVWVGSGQFGLDAPLIIYENTMLWSSPGAIYYRLTTTTPPTALIQNYSFNVVPAGGNIRITGGYWDVANIPQTGVAFSFVNTTAVLVEDLIVVANNDGLSPAAEMYGCTNMTFDNVSVYAAAPQVTSRASQSYPCFRVEECNQSNKPGLPNSCYTGAECQNVVIRNCNATPYAGAVWPSDSYGAYSCFTSFCGTKGTIQNGSRHININIVEGCYATALALAGVECNNWQNTTVTACDFSQPQTPYLTTIDGVSPGTPLYFLYDDNSPRCFPAFELLQVTNTITETTCAQFSIPVNDWIPGTSAYRHHHSGYVTTGATSGKTITFKIYLGTNGDHTDNLIQTIVATCGTSQTTIPYCINHRGFDIDIAGHWVDIGVEALSSCFSGTGWSNGVLVQPGGTRIDLHLTRGSKLYVTITATWNITSSSYILVPLAGVIERVYQ